MFIIAGLGNPGDKYVNTRHNAGFSVIDALADKYAIGVTEEKHKALIGKGVIEGQKVILVKPLTFMNNSGESIREIADYYKVDSESEVIVVFDDISLDPGNIRIRPKGSAGGHNGIKSIIQHLGHQNFMRVKVGVGEKPKGYDLADYVLGHFSEEEKKIMNESYKKSCDAVVTMMNEGVERAMNMFN